MAATESTPLINAPKSNLLQQSSQQLPKPPRTVTFNPTVSSSPSTEPPQPRSQQAASSGGSSSQNAVSAGLSNLNKLRRRHSQGAPTLLPNPSMQKIGPQRTTKTAQKLKLLPDPEHGDDAPDEESGRDVYAQFTRIKDPTARRDAARLGKEDRNRLPRVTAYCTAGSYRMNELMAYLKRRSRIRQAAPKLFDECIYTPWKYLERTPEKSHREATLPASLVHTRRYSDSAVEVESHNEQRRDTQRREDLTDLHSGGRDPYLENHSQASLDPQSTEAEPSVDISPGMADFDTEVHIPEVFLFSYGTVVMWGMTLQQEHRFLKEIAPFEVEKLAKDDVQTEDFNFYYTRDYQARIYNDFISLRDKKNYMTKLAISHALSQSVKVRLEKQHL
jgi:uncharacterized Rmd1/YagE family protein